MDNQPQHQTQVWFITGASKGFGLELTTQLLQQGHQVAATSRDADELRRAVGRESADFLPLAVDLASEAGVGQAIRAAIGQFGRIDVVVNNAGYGQLGALEELTDAETRENFEDNTQPGDPAKLATALIQIASEANPPLHLLLGEDAHGLADGKIKALQADMMQWKDLSMATGFAEPATV